MVDKVHNMGVCILERCKKFNYAIKLQCNTSRVYISFSQITFGFVLFALYFGGGCCSYYYFFFL